MSNPIQSLLVDPTDRVAIQLFRYAFVGGIAAVLDMGTFYLTSTRFGWHYVLAQTAGFLVGLVANYLLSVAWVFRSSGRVATEFGMFVLIGLGGLLLSYGMLWLLIDALHVTALKNMVAKAIAVLAVLAWNFGMRRMFVFRRAA